MRIHHRLAILFLSFAVLAGRALAADFIEFEAGPVRPIALSADGSRLFAVNTPDARLEIFRVGTGGVARTASVAVGLEPVSVAVRNAGEVWVVNHLSDSISIVDVASTPPRVVRTLLVGDEPRDIVFAGPGRSRAFITTAHRGQQRSDPSIAAVPGAGDPQLTTPGVGRADVWVFDANTLGATLGGTPIRIVTLFGDTPRALAVSANGATVYAAIFHSGNQTTTVSEGVVCNGFQAAVPCANPGQGLIAPGGNPGPSTDHNGTQAPEVGLIVKRNAASGNWEDELARNWSPVVRFDLPDRDVFAIDATTFAQTQVWSGVGTILFNMAVNPISGKVYVSNTESKNEVRFEGPGVFAAAFKPAGVPASVRGNLAESFITVLAGGAVLPRHLNKHIVYSGPGATETPVNSLATPLDLVVSPDGSKLYVAAFGSSKVGVFDTATLENDTFDPALQSAQYIQVSGGGPAGLVLDAARNRLYVLTRFDDSISVIDLATKAEKAHVPLFNPEPASVVVGRPFLYDAVATSSNGEASCSSCHVFGDLDGLAWDLGNPDDDETASPMTIRLGLGAGPTINGTGVVQQFSALKGPMTTQTLRGMSNSGPMHWRGDRSNGFFGVSPTDEDLSFRNFIVAFPGLVGRSTAIANSDMQKFSDFMLQVELPPNPVRAIDNSLTPAEANGKAFFLGNSFTSGGPTPATTGVGGALLAGRLSDGVPAQNFGFACDGCHVLDASQGFFGTDGNATFENETQIVKVPHLRNAYQKVGMFGVANTPFANLLNQPHQGNQVRGTGYLHDGSVDTLFDFLHATVFNNSFGGAVGFPAAAAGDGVRRDVEQWVLAFDSDLAPVVGQQVTLTASNAAVATPRIDTFAARAATSFTSKVLGAGAKECDLVAKGTVGGVTHGWLGSGAVPPTFTPDDGTAAISLAALEALAATPGQSLTFTCVTPGAGRRAAIDRDRDNVLDALDDCPAVADAAQADTDGDGVGDACDDCTVRPDPTQLDADADGYGNACDADLNGDGVVNAVDLATLKAAFFTHDTTADLNGDGVVNAVDLALLKAQFFKKPGPSAFAH